jgi:hypothetical protein
MDRKSRTRVHEIRLRERQIRRRENRLLPRGIRHLRARRLPRTNAPVGEAMPIVANATLEMILFRSILFVLRRVVSSAKTISSAGLFQLPNCARADVCVRSASVWQLQILTARPMRRRLLSDPRPRSRSESLNL